VDAISGLRIPDRPQLPELGDALRSLELDAELLATAQPPDPGRPYGRRVLLQTATLEGMIACWKPGVPCAVHDHGGSVGAVRVLAGTGLHRQYTVSEGALHLVAEDPVAPGDILVCGSTFVHAMESGLEEPMITLHLYGPTLPHMIVWDQQTGRTLKVSGGCGAWVPAEHEADQLLEVREGLVPAW